MKIKDILASKAITVSLEVFPPKQWDKLEQTKRTVEKLLKFTPDFISVTYGAAGTTSGYTKEIAANIIKNGGTPLSHLTCVNSTKVKVEQVIEELKSQGIENILALRGDLAEFGTHPNEFRYASELIDLIKAHGDFCIGAACYPEKHPESESVESDLKHLKIKADAGADFLTTQMFFDNSAFYSFKENCQSAGIDVPIVAGIMPITAVSQIGRSVSLSGCTIPKDFSDLAAKYSASPEEMKKAGIDYAINQIRSLIENGQKHIHIYTMNKPETTGAVLEGIKDLI